MIWLLVDDPWTVVWVGVAMIFAAAVALVLLLAGDRQRREADTVELPRLVAEVAARGPGRHRRRPLVPPVRHTTTYRSRRGNPLRSPLGLYPTVQQRQGGRDGT